MEGWDAAEELVAGPVPSLSAGLQSACKNGRKFVTVLARLSLDLPVDAAVQC
jgi:hypothetical protein